MKGMPADVEALFPQSKQAGILILDDLMSAMNKDEQALHTVTVKAHHRNIFLNIYTAVFAPERQKRGSTVTKLSL